ncbi:FAD-binding oxidoreductase [Streptomyces albidus (ex Kaewkla and Franco 2022)]|uniref:FAD-binding oxidoreductase n=1 Tax=Streptomyces albidus (ex Kaewkla and Franco 2022) TaxID=722709 RepID=UPI0015EE5582|nr:FAD-binding oxidoreductase [Streptomyces albidus (ex Kaewkla and Franco 2022)]
MPDGSAAGLPDGFPRSLVRGPVLIPGDDGYDEERSGFQTGYRHRPGVIVCATVAEDVRLAVKYAAEHALPLAVQATGHGLAAPVEGGVLVSTRRMTDVRVDAGARTAWIEAGVRWGRVVEEAARHGLAPLSGSGPGVGAVSYTLGGGIGLLARQYGYAADHVRSIDVVTADARLRHLTEESEPDLFWAMRGGGSGFGLVTGMEIELMPLEHFYGGQLIFDGELAEAVLQRWREWTRTVPEELTSSVTLLAYPDIPVLPEQLRGRYVAQVQVAFNGTEAEGERLVAPLLAIGPRVSETLRTMPYTESAGVYNEPDQPHAYRGGNVLLGECPDPAALRRVLELTGPKAPLMTVVSLRHMGGALSRAPEPPNAVRCRDASLLLVVLSVTEGGDPAVPEALHEKVFDAVSPWTVGSNLNFRYGRPVQTAHGGVRAAHGADDQRRLAGLKALVDPVNLFRFHQGAPAAPE